jgi:hypothetical protein
MFPLRTNIIFCSSVTYRGVRGGGGGGGGRRHYAGGNVGRCNLWGKKKVPVGDRKKGGK